VNECELIYSFTLQLRTIGSLVLMTQTSQQTPWLRLILASAAGYYTYLLILHAVEWNWARSLHSSLVLTLALGPLAMLAENTLAYFVSRKGNLIGLSHFPAFIIFSIVLAFAINFWTTRGMGAGNYVNDGKVLSVGHVLTTIGWGEFLKHSAIQSIESIVVALVVFGESLSPTREST